MPVAMTEELHDEAKGLDARPALSILDTLLRAQVEAASAVEAALPSIATAAALAADVFEKGGRLGYAAAGSSGLMALADGLELPGTFGMPREQIAILFAGGAASLRDMTGGPEDDAAQAVRDVDAARLASGDCLVGVSASGSTPYAVAALRSARQRGAKTIAIANNEAAPLFESADVAILLATPPEVIAGSTRMGAGTAQKIALNLFSTLLGVRLGHVHDGYMVNVHADNRKLRSRAARIVASISGCAPEEAERLVAETGTVKTAVLLAAGAPDATAAGRILESASGRLRAAISTIEGSKRSSKPAA
jgi:N-acetylmuramic acid 6-phosphate etherase